MLALQHWKTLLCIGACAAALAGSANAATFVNGNFETGDATGWTIGGGYRGSTANNVLTPEMVLPGGALYDASIANGHSSIVNGGFDSNTGNALRQVYSGNYSWRVEDTVNGGYGSAIAQNVNAYSAPNIFFAWAAVLEGAHGLNDAATVKIYLRDLTVGDVLVAREYNAASSGGGVDARFTYNPSTNYYWTDWQIENILLPANRMGNNFELSILASDCEPTGHVGYLYLDGFGAVPPPPPPPPGAVPEPGTYVLMVSGLVGMVLARRRFAN